MALEITSSGRRAHKTNKKYHYKVTKALIKDQMSYPPQLFILGEGVWVLCR